MGRYRLGVEQLHVESDLLLERHHVPKRLLVGIAGDVQEAVLVKAAVLAGVRRELLEYLPAAPRQLHVPSKRVVMADDADRARHRHAAAVRSNTRDVLHAVASKEVADCGPEDPCTDDSNSHAHTNLS